MRNRIINGAMVIDQRNAGASVSNTAAGLGTYTLDRWLSYGTVATRFSIQQNAGAVTPPAGFSNYLGVTSSAATTVGASDIYYITQRIEGFNTADLGWGTASAKTITVSFWVRSSLTGTFGGALLNSAGTRSYPFTYTISSANTWEYETITIVGETTGAWVTNNGVGISVVFGLGVGSTFSTTAGAWASGTFVSATGATSVVGTSGATFYITGVQLEVGTQATSFEYRQYGTELVLCQRYCYVWGGDNVYQSIGYGLTDTANRGEANLQFPVTMRTAPSVTFSSTASQFRAQAYNITGGAVNAYAATGTLADGFSVLNARILFTVAAGIGVAQPTQLSANNSTSPRITVSAEL
jgi:hypothetical protein